MNKISGNYSMQYEAVAPSNVKISDRGRINFETRDFKTVLAEKQGISSALKERETDVSDAFKELEAEMRIKALKNLTTNGMDRTAKTYDSSSVFNTSSVTDEMTVTTKKFLPDGSILVITRRNGKIIEETKKKPDLVPEPDTTKPRVKNPDGTFQPQTMKMTPHQNLFDLL